MTDPMQIGQADSPLADRFIRGVNALDSPYVLEFGTRRADPDFATHHRDWLPTPALHIKCDIEAGIDVDEVHDIHYLPPTFTGVYDAVIAVAVFEHLKRPWVAAAEISRALVRGGLLFVSTHQSFPLHGYPSDFFRFSAQALALIFEDAGMEIIAAEYQCPCQIVPGPEIQRWNSAAPAWLVTELLAVKP